MTTTFVEYSVDGEIFHVCQVETTEGHMPPLVASATDAEREAHQEAVDAAIARRVAVTRAELNALRAQGKRLLVLPDGMPTPESGRHRVDHDTKRLIRRSDAELAAYLAQLHAHGGAG